MRGLWATVRTRGACSVIQVVKHNPLATPQTSPQVVNIAEKTHFMVARVGSLGEGKASLGIVNGSYVDWKKAAVSRGGHEFRYGMNLFKMARSYSTEPKVTDFEFGIEEESGGEKQ